MKSFHNKTTISILIAAIAVSAGCSIPSSELILPATHPGSAKANEGEAPLEPFLMNNTNFVALSPETQGEEASGQEEGHGTHSPKKKDTPQSHEHHHHGHGKEEMK